MSEMLSESRTGLETGRGGKYLTFFLAEEEYGIHILKIQEIIGVIRITQVPRTPSFFKGVVNLRGRIIPVVDLRLKFEMESAETTSETCIIILQLEYMDSQVTAGVIVDRVSEVIDIPEDEVEDTPEFGNTGIGTDFITGIGKTASGVIILLDVDRILSPTEKSLLSNSIQV